MFLPEVAKIPAIGPFEHETVVRPLSIVPSIFLIGSAAAKRGNEADDVSLAELIHFLQSFDFFLPILGCLLVIMRLARFHSLDREEFRTDLPLHGVSKRRAT